MVDLSAFLGFADKLRISVGELLKAERARRKEIAEYLNDVAVLIDKAAESIKQGSPSDVARLASEIRVHGENGSSLFYGVLSTRENEELAAQIVDIAKVLKTEPSAMTDSSLATLSETAGRLKGLARLLTAPSPRIPRTMREKDFWKEIDKSSNASHQRFMITAGYLSPLIGLGLIPPLFGLIAVLIAIQNYRSNLKRHAIAQLALTAVITPIGIYIGSQSVQWGYDHAARQSPIPIFRDRDIKP
ncbi:hypothetical protein [Methylobacterium sp. PvR107]|uniref:hypothetical protein n=1 Tax=Methylobacterium sp. PvR107 TaxID=2806597 RepID=UPI001AE42BCB|nr:hypothetical protein [Methylobacterium sp. PvR107]MBP1182179.1 hypothetical protein [Methylobacterium sp. PvR107]